MRIKEIFWLMGFKPKVKKYRYLVKKVNLEKEGEISIAQWQHPRMGEYIPTQAEIDALREFVRPGDTCVDIGAHMGDTTIPMGLAAGQEGVVFALEPNSYVYETLEANARLNMDKSTIIPLSFAATPEDMEMEFQYSDAGFCNGGFHENMSIWRHWHIFKLKVKGKNLVNYLDSHYPDRMSKLRFIKIDAEGYDLSILKSLNPIIDKYLPYLRVEIFKKSNLEYRTDMFNFLNEKGYKLYFFGGSGNYRGKELTNNDLMNKMHYDIFAVPPMSN